MQDTVAEREFCVGLLAVKYGRDGKPSGFLRDDGKWRYPRLADGDSLLPPVQFPPKLLGAQEIIVDARPFTRGRIVWVLRNGQWRHPRLAVHDLESWAVQLPNPLVS